MNNERDIFYDTRGLSYAQKEDLLWKAYSICSKWCGSISWIVP